MRGSTLKKLLKEKGILQRELAEALGVTQGHVSRMLGGHVQIDPEYLPKITALLGLSDRELRQIAAQSYAGEYVQSPDAFNAWQDAVGEADELEGEVRTLLVLIGMSVDKRFWVASVTTDALGKKFLGAELVEQHMPDVLESGWVERLGPAEYALVLQFPE